MASSVEVAQGLREAAAYERFQLQRRRGHYQLTLGTILLAMGGLQYSEGAGAWSFFAILSLFVALFLVLMWMHKRREWQLVYPGSATGWPDRRQWRASGIGIGAVAVVIVLNDMAGARLVTGAILVGYALNQWLWFRRTDPLLAWGSAIIAPVGLLLGLPVVPADATMLLLMVVIGFPLASAGAVRTLGPRRWLE